MLHIPPQLDPSHQSPLPSFPPLSHIPPLNQELTPRPQKGKGWAEINILWHSLTGQTPGSTTLPNRLTRIRENIGDFTPEDDRLMLKCKREIEETFSRELWAMTAEQMLVKGGTKFSVSWKEGFVFGLCFWVMTEY